MKTILISYLVMINLVSFILMGIDKRRARLNRWRISERTLLTVSLIFGSIGGLIGMYFFHHKTKHAVFKFGIPCMLLLHLLIIAFFSWHNIQQRNSPSQAVRYELSLIRELDDDTIRSFVSYENLTGSHLLSETDDSDAVSAVRLFFRNFDYKITDETIRDDSAEVHVDITNLDMHALAADICTELYRSSAEIHTASEARSDSAPDYYQLLSNTLSSGDYDVNTTEAVFHLKKNENGWVILADDSLEDELVSGFISYMNDPYLLSASDLLSIRLDALKSLSGQEWLEYLEINDVFATYNTDYSTLIDEEFTEQISRYFDYEIISCEENGASSDATIQITSLDMTSILTSYKKYLITYAGTTKSIRDNSVQVSNETSRLLLNALSENETSSSTDLELHFRNNGTTWEISLGATFTNAVMGNMDQALDTFNELTRDSFHTEED